MIKKILVSQPEPTGKSPYFDIAKKYDVQIDFRPLVHVERLTEKEFRAQKVNILDFTAIVFNSHHAIDFFFSMCKDMRLTMPDDMKYFFISENVALYIQKYIQYRKRKIFFSKSASVVDMLDLMAKHKKEKYLFPQNEVHHNNMGLMFEAKGLIHTEANFFRTVSTILEKDKTFDYDMVIFFTPSGIRSLTQDNFPGYKQGDVCFGTLGRAAAETVKDFGFRLDFQAPTPECPSLTSALDKFLEQQMAEKNN